MEKIFRQLLESTRASNENLREYFTLTERAPPRLPRAFSRLKGHMEQALVGAFNQVMVLLRDCEIFGNLRLNFQSQRLQSTVCRLL